MTDLPTDLTPLILQGHVLDVLRELPENSVQCCVSSPPYWGLRAYGTEPQVWRGVAGHEHKWQPTNPRRQRSEADATSTIEQASVGGRNYEAQGGESCECGAWRGELGAEPTPEMYVDHLAEVFDEVKRVLREDGTLWLNLGDTYTTHPAGLTGAKRWAKSGLGNVDHEGHEQAGAVDKRTGALPEKNLVGIPWRVAFELQRRGWFLRAENIWAKPNPMPESVRDRPTRAHEQVFLLTKSARYFYDADAVRKPLAPSTEERAKNHYSNPTDNPETNSKYGSGHRRSYPVLSPAMRAAAKYSPSTLREIEEGYDGRATKEYLGTGAQDPSATKARIIAGARARLEAGLEAGPNLKTVWWITTQPYPDAHFATFPEALVEVCLKAGTSERGACAKCGTPWDRETRNDHGFTDGVCNGCGAPENKHIVTAGSAMVKFGSDSRTGTAIPCGARHSVGWFTPCACGPSPSIPCLVMDPFAGSGTVLSVARSLGLRSIGIELKPEYVEQARRRSKADTPDLFSFADSDEPSPISGTR